MDPKRPRQPGAEAGPGDPQGAAAQRRSADPDALLRDARSLLAEAVRRLRARSGWGALAWVRDPSGAPAIGAADCEMPEPRVPSEADFAAAATLTGATDLAEPALAPGLRRLAQRENLGAAAPVRRDGEALAVLLLRGRTVGRPRPRALALLEATARQLADPLAAARALARLGRLDDELCRLDRLAALGALAGEIAHEVRNPLVSVSSLLQMLPERRDDPELMTDLVPLASAELRRIGRLLDAVIEHPVPGAAPRGPADVRDAIGSVALLVGQRARARGVALDVTVARDVPAAAIGPDALRQALLNLVLNALDVTPREGRVRLAATPGRGGVELRVVDRGPGVPARDRERIFAAFHTTAGAGHGGLGLAITRRLVEAAGGAIEVSDAAGGGAEFRLWLPRAGPGGREISRPDRRASRAPGDRAPPVRR